MGIHITAAGKGVIAGPQQELPQDWRSARHARMLAEERKAAAIEKFISSIPGYREPVNLYSTAKNLEQISLMFNRKLKFIVDYESHEVIVKVIDGTTDKVIKILPPEELQRLHRKIRETLGFILDERV